MKIKVCGMRQPDNLRAVTALEPDFIGFIFHPKSPRYVSDIEVAKALEDWSGVKKVGVFVNADLEDILGKAENYELDMVQLHGDESPGFCATVAGFVPVAKAFRIGPEFDFEKTTGYQYPCEMFVFDARGAAPGGNGIKYDWELLKAYTGETPFLLSGGIGPNDAAAIKAFSHQKCIGIDLNSGFELSPGLKDEALLANFKTDLFNITE